MFHNIINRCFGYKELEITDNTFAITSDTDYIVLIKSETLLELRKYVSMFRYKKVYTNNLMLAYNSEKDIIYDDNFTIFDKLTLTEFIHLVIPNKKLEINYILLEDYHDNLLISEMKDFYDKQENYMCKCRLNSEKCVFHKFLIENLYNKYIKNVT